MINPENISKSNDFYVPIYIFETLLRDRIVEYLEIDDRFGANWLEAIKNNEYLFNKINEIISKITVKTNSKPNIHDVFATISLGDIINIFTPDNISKSKLSGMLSHVFKIKSSQAGHKTMQTDIYKKMTAVLKLRNDIFHFKPIVGNINYSHIDKTINNFIYHLAHSKEMVEYLRAQFKINIHQPPII